MQDRYLGDAHDFIKYAFIRYLSRATDLNLGLHWYRTDPEVVGDSHTGDGEKRHHLKGGFWADWDGELLEALRLYEDPAKRSIAAFERAGILPSGIVTVSELVPRDGRDVWHRDALHKLQPCNWIFCDPDNGFLVPSATKKRRAKYAEYSEVADLARAGAIVTCIQFARQCDPVKRGYEMQSKLLAELPGCKPLPIIRCRIAPNVLYVTVASKTDADLVAGLLEGFVDNSRIRTDEACKVELLSGHPSH